MSHEFDYRHFIFAARDCGLLREYDKIKDDIEERSVELLKKLKKNLGIPGNIEIEGMEAEIKFLPRIFVHGRELNKIYEDLVLALSDLGYNNQPIGERSEAKASPN